MQRKFPVGYIIMLLSLVCEVAYSAEGGNELACLDWNGFATQWHGDVYSQPCSQTPPSLST